MKLVINNDDLGLTYGVNKAATECFQKGLTTSASIVVNTPLFNETVSNIRSGRLKGIGIGIHLNLTDGPTSTKELSDIDGNYKYGFVSLFRQINLNKHFISYIQNDLEEQIKKCLKAKITLDHLDSDKHVHMLPQIFEVCCKLAKKYKIPFIRISREPIYFEKKSVLYPFMSNNLLKNLILNRFAQTNIPIAKRYGLKSTDAVYGILYTNKLSPQVFQSSIKNAIKNKFKIIEILIHPGYVDDPRDTTAISPSMYKYAKLKNRADELNTLLDSGLKTYLAKNGVELVRFLDI